jgi:hypothetical protein
VDIPERYVWLCLRVGRHAEGFVDAYTGPPEWERIVAAEARVDPGRLREEALGLLDELDAADLQEDRRRWLRGQLEALGCVTARISGEAMAWADEVERCLGVRPTWTDTSALEDVHRRLDAALPGMGTVRERYRAWDERTAVAREQVVPALERLKDVLGPRAHALAPLPPDESVVYELVSDVPWSAYNWYQGRHRSRIEVNADLPISAVVLVDLAAHEAYPGHHTERSAKEAHLTGDLGRQEASIVITPAPESLVSEGIALNALEAALGPQPFGAVAEVLRGMDLGFDPAEADEVYRAERALYATVTNAAFMLHEQGATTREAEEFLREWALGSDERAARTVEFVTAPSSRAYVSAYPDGDRLCKGFAERAPGNFSKLLTEQLTTVDLLP